MKRLNLAVSAIALALAGAVGAAAADRDDQILTRAEAQQRAEQLFDRLDVNHDGRLDKADRVASLNQMFDRIDTNHDGVISRDEFAAAHAGMMEHGRGDGDHSWGEHYGDDHPGMGRDPMSHDGPPPMGEAGMAPHDGPGMGPMDHGQPGGTWHEGGDRDGMLVMAILHQADPDHTGTITRDAFVGAALAIFDKADTNHDGQLTPDERRAAWSAAQEMHARHHAPIGDGAMPPPPPSGM